MKITFVHNAATERWSWLIVAHNGHVVARSNDEFSRRTNAVRSAERFCAQASSNGFLIKDKQQ